MFWSAADKMQAPPKQLRSDVNVANSLVEAVKDKDVSLAGIEPKQTAADFTHQSLGLPDAVLPVAFSLLRVAGRQV
jgi:hypothetical protein